MPVFLRCSDLRFLSAASVVAVLALAGVAGPASADTKSALPAAIDNFKLTKAIVLYTPATLESLVDGEAEAIGRYGFKDCAHGEYAPKGQGNQLMTADVFQFGNAAEAYGMYSSQRSPNATFLKIGAEGYKQADALNFWKGAYYVRIAITASNKAPFQTEMPKLAAAIASKVTGSTALPDIVKTLPPGYTPKTEQYRLSDIAAQAYIRNGMVAKYPRAGQQAELFVAQFPSKAAAADAFTKYSAYLNKNLAAGAKVSTLSGVGEKGISLKTKFTGDVITALKGKTLVGIRYVAGTAAQQSAALGLVKAAVAKAS